MFCMGSLMVRLWRSGIWLALLLVACGGDGQATIEDAGPGPAEHNVGAPCGMLGDGGLIAVSFTTGAPECASGMCLSGQLMPGALGPTNTSAYCTATCNQDDDCAGQLRDPADPLDTRCQNGFVCGVLFVKGRLCCVRMCVCKDSLGPAGLPTPIACQGEAAATCNQ
jgi:hypothetical protein